MRSPQNLRCASELRAANRAPLARFASFFKALPLVAVLAWLALLAPLVGCGSNTQPFNDTPAVQNLFPTNATAGGASFTLNIIGTGFISTSTAFWNNTQLTTTLDPNTLQLSASIPAALIASPGVAQVIVVSPAPGGGMSNAITFTINAPSNPVPTISSLSPGNVALNTLPPNGVLLVNGTNFLASSSVAFNGVSRTPNSVTSTQLSVPVLASDVASNTTIAVTVSNPTPGGGVSNTASFVVGIGHSARLAPNAVSANVGGGAVEVVSESVVGGPSNGASGFPVISADGRYVAFYSTATNLIASGASGNIFVHDPCFGATDCTPRTLAVDLAADGEAPNGASEPSVAISGDGRFVAFASKATNLLSGTASATSGSEVYVRDLCLGSSAPAGCSPHTELASIGDDKTAFPAAGSPSISADGRYVTFASGQNVFVRDTCAGSDGSCVTKTLSVNSVPGANMSDSYSAPAISASGRYVAFVATDPGTLSASSVLLADTCFGTEASASCRPKIAKVSISADGADLAGENASPSISGDGRFVAFASNDASGASKVLLRDTCLGISAATNCATFTSLLSQSAVTPFMSANGRFVSFVSAAGASAANVLNVYDTCYGVPTGCVARPSALPFSVATASVAPMNADGSGIVFATSAAIAELPLSGQGDVLLFTPNF
jgi:Tol biopolymer transport system component